MRTYQNKTDLLLAALPFKILRRSKGSVVFLTRFCYFGAISTYKYYIFNDVKHTYDGFNSFKVALERYKLLCSCYDEKERV